MREFVKGKMILLLTHFICDYLCKVHTHNVDSVTKNNAETLNIHVTMSLCLASLGFKVIYVRCLMLISV